MNECVWMCVREVRRINLRIMYVGICIEREFWTLIAVYAPGMERSEEERDGFWKELKGNIRVCEDRGKVVIIGDMNARVGDNEIGVVGKFGVSWANENERKLSEMCTESRLSVGNRFVRESISISFHREVE